MFKAELKEKVNSLPKVPGVYIYTDSAGEIIYVGKARSLRNRVGSYFKTNLDESSKTFALVSRINDINYIEVESEFDALILEAELIKKYHPKYNILLKDDKSYIYIVIKNEFVEINGKKINLPKVSTARKTTLEKNDIVFGPYPDGTTVKYLLRTIRKIYPFRDCSISKFAKFHKLHNPCLYGHIGLCPAPCVNNSPEGLQLYRSNISKIKKILQGKSSSLIKDIEANMKTASKNEKFEEAAVYRDLLNKFNYIRSTYHAPLEYIGNPYLVEDMNKEALDSLSTNIPSLKVAPERIECYDIANISGKEAVGSMVVSINGKIENSEYRRFKIKFKNTPDDFEMMREVLYRRFKRELSDNPKIKKWGLPSLLVVDGGKGQVSAALDIFEELKINVPLIGLAKKQETIVYKDEEGFHELSLPKTDPGLKLLIKLRDEAHRFAQSYHHLLRLKSINI